MNTNESAETVSSSVRDCTSTPTIYMDACQLNFDIYSATGSQYRKFTLPPDMQRLFFAKMFTICPSGKVVVNKGIGTNGALLTRKKMSGLGPAASAVNQLTLDERTALIQRSNGLNPWVEQTSDFISSIQYLLDFINGSCNPLRISEANIGRLEFYTEVPLFSMEGSFEEDMSRLLSSLFGSAQKHIDNSPKAKLDGDFRKWQISLERLPKGSKAFVKAYVKGDLVRIELAFENIHCRKSRSPHDYPFYFPAFEVTLRSAFLKYGAIAQRVLAGIYDHLSASIPDVDVALIRNYLKTRCRSVDTDRKFDYLIMGLEKGAYTPASLLDGCALSYRTLKRLADPVTGILAKCETPAGCRTVRTSYVLRPDWKEVAMLAIASSKDERPTPHSGSEVKLVFSAS